MPWKAPLTLQTPLVREPVLDEPVLVAGSSDETHPPFNFSARLKTSLDGLDSFEKARQDGIGADLGLIALKSGIVASSSGYEFSNDQASVKGWTSFVDNGMHSGASGGPVIDQEGRVFSVITSGNGLPGSTGKSFNKWSGI